jgi:hypothetical protein
VADWVGCDSTDAASQVDEIFVLTPILGSRCLRCNSTTFLVRLPYGSIYDGEYVCARCLDAALFGEYEKFRQV